LRDTFLRAVLILASLPLCEGVLRAQWTLREVVERAGARYPGVAVSLEQSAAAAAGVREARTVYLPKAQSVLQLNRATDNNVPGLLLPGTFISPISGPIHLQNAGTSAWGSAVGFLVNWEPFDLGQRPAHVAAAQASQAKAEKTLARTRFDVEAAAADAFLTVLAADATAERAMASLERARALETSVRALTESGLKPGADLARATAERAAAEAQVVQAELAAKTARVAVAQLTGDPAASVAPVSGKLAAEPPASGEPAATSVLLSHPAVAEQQAAVDEVEARRKEIAKAYAPRFYLQSSLYARGTGLTADGASMGGANGLGPNYYNWGLGFSVVFPFLDQPQIRAQREAEGHRAAAEEASLRRLKQDLSAQEERAVAQLDAARKLAALAPVQATAARSAMEQSQARYKSGLAPLLEVAEAQRLLLQSEIDEALARLNVWRMQLSLATARGDLQPFLEAAEKPR
jgi:outer membrane protein TolC